MIPGTELNTESNSMKHEVMHLAWDEISCFYFAILMILIFVLIGFMIRIGVMD